MLGEAKSLECLMLSAPTRLVKRSRFTMTVYLILFVVCFLIQYFFTFPRLPAVQVYLNMGLMATTILFYLLASFTKPGYILNNDVDFMDMLDAIDST